MGAVLLGLAPFFPFTYATVSTWQVPLRGVFLYSSILIFLGAAVLLQAVWGRGSLLLSWVALAAGTVALWRDMTICLKDVGIWLGKAQLALSGVNRLLIALGVAPWHLVSSQEISSRTLAVGFYLAVAGLVLAVVGSLLWLGAQGRQAVWPRPARCQCGQVLRGSFKFCPCCARELTSEVGRCAHCGTLLEKDWKCCPECGQVRLRE